MTWLVVLVAGFLLIDLGTLYLIRRERHACTLLLRQTRLRQLEIVEQGRASGHGAIVAQHAVADERRSGQFHLGQRVRFIAPNRAPSMPAVIVRFGTAADGLVGRALIEYLHKERQKWVDIDSLVADA